jgi:hypothetical protein
LQMSSFKALLKRMEDPEVGQVSLRGGSKGTNIKKVLALVLATPDFQRK